MALSDRKISGFSQSVSALADRPEMTAAALKAVFDSRTDNEVKSAVNGVIDDLISGAAASEIKAGDVSIVSRFEACEDDVDTLYRENVSLDTRLSALEGHGYYKIADIEVDGENVPCTSAIRVEQDENGDPFSLDGLTVLLEVPATEHANGILYLRSGTTTVGQRMCVSDAAARACVIEARFAGVWRTFWSYDSTLHANAPALYASLAQNYSSLPRKITSIGLALGTKNTGTAVFPVGTKISIYGRCGI